MSQLTCDMVPPLQSAYSSPLQGTAATAAAVITFTMMLKIKLIAFIVRLNLYVYSTPVHLMFNLVLSAKHLDYCKGKMKRESFHFIK